MGDFIEFTTLPEQQHIFYKITSSAIGFSVRGERHAAVGLAKRPFQKCEYWIVFGQSQCWVEIDGTRTNVNEVPNILPRQVYTKYWISWHSTCLQFGRTSDGVPLITREIPAQDLHFVTFFVYADRGTQQWKIFLPPKLQKPFLKRVEGGDMHWVDAEDKLPDGALIGGYEKEILYIMKASHCGAVIPGILVPSQGAGFIAWGTVMLKKNKFQRRSSIAVRRVAPEPTAPTAPTVCATPSPRPRCRIRTNPWLGTSPNARRRAPSVLHQQSLQCPQAPTLQHAPYSLDSHPKYGSRSPHLSPRLSPHLSPHLSPEPYRTPYYRGGVSSDEECRGMKPRGRETAILSDADVDSDGDTGLDGGDEDEPDSTASPGKRRARRRRPPRRTPRSAGATPPRMRRRCHAPSAPPVRERDPLLEADREAERKYRELIREAEKLLVTVSRSPIEPPHNPRVRELRATEVDAPRRSPERTHVTNFIRANSPEPPRRLSPVARRSPLAAPPPPRPQVQPPSPTDRPHSEPPKRKAYARDEVLQTLEGLRKSLQQQSALLAVQRTRLDSL